MAANSRGISGKRFSIGGTGLLDVGGHLIERALVLAALERGAAGQEFVERAAQAVDVGADIDGVAVGGLLRGHVIGRAHGLAGAGHLLARSWPRNRIGPGRGPES